MKSVVLVGLTFATAVALSAQTPSAFEERYFTQNQPNCRWFNDLNLFGRYAYIAGLWDALRLVNTESNWNPYWVGATYGETTEGMAALCSVPENARIRAFDAYEIFAAKTKGMDDATISEMTAQARIYATYGVTVPMPNPPPPPKKSEPKREKL